MAEQSTCTVRAHAEVVYQSRMSKPVLWLFAWVITQLFWSACVSAAEPGVPDGTWALLDGRSFQGQMLSSDGKPLADKERLVFKDGRFTAEACKQHGFTEAPYWIRVENGRIHFLAETTSPTHGKMLWKGTVSGRSVDARSVWTKERWYWTIEREFKVRAVEQR